MGTNRFWNALGDYVEAYRLGLGGTRDLLDTLVDASEADLLPRLRARFPEPVLTIPGADQALSSGVPAPDAAVGAQRLGHLPERRREHRPPGLPRGDEPARDGALPEAPWQLVAARGPALGAARSAGQNSHA